jgi:translation initiation factor 3 subunit H
MQRISLASSVILKIKQHCDESLPLQVTGQLLGLDVGNTLEVTDCFAFPVSFIVYIPPACADLIGIMAAQVTVADEETEDENAGASYQLDMMRCLREVNVDNNTVGW